MIYSDSAKYAVMACVELAAQRDDSPVQIAQIAASTGISYPYLAKVIQSLVKAGILNSTRGRGGGIDFTGPPSQLTLVQVVKAVDGEHVLDNCIFGLHNCDGMRHCPMHPLWGPIREQIITFMQDTTIADLASGDRSGSVEEMLPGVGLTGAVN